MPTLTSHPGAKRNTNGLKTVSSTAARHELP